MFYVYVQDGDFELDDQADVLKLLHAHNFRGEGDFFTIGRGDVDYLEIYRYSERFSLAYIPRGADESRPLADELPRPLVERLAAAFCDGGDGWRAVLADANLDPAATRRGPTAARAADPGNAPPPAAPVDARPLEPAGVTAGRFFRIVFILSVAALLTAIGYAFLHR